MRIVAEVVPRCATTSRALALHILTTQNGNKQCRFHDMKRGTKGAKEVDRPDFIVGVAYSKPMGRAEPVQGFFHCGCDEDAALWDFFLVQNLDRRFTERQYHVYRPHEGRCKRCAECPPARIL